MAKYRGFCSGKSLGDPMRKRIFFVIVAFTILVIFFIFLRFTALGSNPTLISGYNILLESLHDKKPPHPSNVAVMIEGRPITHFAPLLLHFSSVLGPAWPIILYVTEKASENMPTSAPFGRALQDNRIQIRRLPSNVTFTVRDEVSAFLTSPYLWEDLAPASHVLLFQADSMICANSEQRVEDFLQYDFVGAPIDPTMGKGDVGMNGGLSLRNRTLILEVIRRFSWATERSNAANPHFPPVAYEDQWFYAKMQQLNREVAERDNWDGRHVARLPDQEEAMKFAVESMWYDKPLGYHQGWDWNRDHIAEIEQWCPEYHMAVSEKIQNA